MKKLLALLAVIVFLALGGRSLWAHGDDNTPDQTLTGEVVCVSCYLAHDGEGEEHAKCAKKCFAKGMPIGLKVGDKLYLAAGEGHESANKMLGAYAGLQVSVTGHVMEKDGMSMVEVETIVPADITSPKDSATGNVDHKTYFCSMDGYTSDKPGKCPKCGMDLTEKK